MSGNPTLAVLAAPALDDGVREFLRVCVGVVAGGGALTLVEVGCGRGVLGGDQEKPGEVERHLEGLASFGVVPRTLSPAELRDLLVVSDRVLRVAGPSRRGTPELVILDEAWLADVSDEALIETFEQAGQVVTG